MTYLVLLEIELMLPAKVNVILDKDDKLKLIINMVMIIKKVLSNPDSRICIDF